MSSEEPERTGLPYDVETLKHQNGKFSDGFFGRAKNLRSSGSPLTFLKGALAKHVKTDDLSQDDIIIALMGPTGSGKSSFINIITGLETRLVGHHLESCTSEVSNVRFSIPEMAFGDLVFVDTPGFDDTHKSDVDILKMIAGWLKSTYEKKIFLSGLLYFHRISDNRMAGTPLKNLRMFEELCGKNAFQNIILTTTMWDEVDEETGEAREEELKSNYWKSMLDRNSTTSRFMRTRESAFLVIDPLIDAGNKRSSLLIQKEMVDMRQKLPSTSAGQELFSMMGDLVRQREDLLRRIRDEMKRTSGDKMTWEPLQQENQSLRLNLEATLDEMRRLKLPLGHRLLNMTNKFLSANFQPIIKSLILSLRLRNKAPVSSSKIDSSEKPFPQIDPQPSTHVNESIKSANLPTQNMDPAPEANIPPVNLQSSTVVKQSIPGSTSSPDGSNDLPLDGKASEPTGYKSQAATQDDAVDKNSQNVPFLKGASAKQKPVAKDQISIATPDLTRVPNDSNTLLGDGEGPKRTGSESQAANASLVSTNEEHTQSGDTLRTKPLPPPPESVSAEWYMSG